MNNHIGMDDALIHLHGLLGPEHYDVMVVFHESMQTCLLITIAIHLLFARRRNEPAKEAWKEPDRADEEIENVLRTNADQIEEILRRRNQQPKTNQERIHELNEIIKKKKPKQL